MQNIFIELLPPWVETGLQPAFYDKESGSVLQQTARMYAKLNELVGSVNNQNSTITDYIEQFNQLHDYVDDYFDNLNVQNEINTKLDSMAEDGQLSEVFSEYFADYVNPQIEAQNRRISDVEDRVNSAVSGQPKVVSSTSQMSDHNQIYVNTTDNKWYYWNGRAWTIGGSYPASSIGNGSVDLGNLTNRLASAIYDSYTDVTKLCVIQYSTANNSANFTSPMLIKAGTTVTLSDDFVANYHWNFKRVEANGYIISTVNPNINSETTDTTYTFTNDEYCVFSWRPIDNNWESETYTVNRSHQIDNDDITGINFYIKHDNRFKLIDVDSSLLQSYMFGGANYGTDTGMQYSVSRLENSRAIYSNYQILFHCAEGYQYDYAVVSDSSPNPTRISHTGWTTGDILIPAKTYFIICIKANDGSNFAKTLPENEKIIELNSYSNYEYIKSYVDSQLDHTSTYNYNGIDLNLQYKHGYEYTASTPLTSGYRSIQGFTVYGNYIFQFYAVGQGLLRIFDKGTGALIAEHDSYTSHGGSCAFSNTYADPDDDFPLLYVSTGSYEYHQITVLRIADVNTVTVYKTYRLDADKLGYWSEQCFDFDTGLCYSFGYTKNDFADMVNNPTKVCVIDLNSETLIANNNYSLDVIENYTIPYVYVIQSCKFKNGLCYIVSAYQGSVQASDIKVYDPAAKSFVANFPDLPLPLRGEIEDIDFVENPTTSKYDMIVGVNGDPNFWKLSFM